MAIEHKDVMDAVAGAAGGAMGLGAVFVAFGAAAALRAAGRQAAPKRLSRLGILAFLSTLISAFLASGWTLIASQWKDTWVLNLVYLASIVLFVVSMVIFLVVFVWAAALLWTSDLSSVADKLFGKPPART